MRIRHKMAVAIASFGLLAGLSVAGAHVAEALPPPVQICNNQSPQLCMNRAGGGSTEGTTVTGYSAGDVHGTYEGITLSGRCNNGHVSALMQCPFENQAYNVTYDNDRIMSIEEYVDDWCAGTNTSISTTVLLAGCPNIDGGGGGWATQWVWNGAGASFNCLINVEKTNVNGDGSHIWGLLAHGKSNALTIATGNNSPCSNAALWKEFFT